MQESSPRDASRLEKQRQFIRAMSKSIDGRRMTTRERDLLDAVLGSLILGRDVFGMIGVERPHNRRPGDPVYIALHYLCLRRLMRQSPDSAWHTVAETWGLKRRQVRWVIADNHVPALKVLERFSDDPSVLLRLCEWRGGGGGKGKEGKRGRNP